MNQSTNTTFAGVIGSSGALTKSGAGKLTFSGANMNTGLTTVNNGTLALTGSLSGSATVDGATALLTSGTASTITGAVSAANGGTIAPGTTGGIGTLNTGAFNLRKMIERARATYGSPLRVLLVGSPNINKAALVATKSIASERESKLGEPGDGFAKLAEEISCDFASCFGVVPETSMGKEGVHPDAVGNTALAKFLLPKVAEMN